MRAGRSLRLLFDENLPWRVASALWELGFHVSYVGDAGDASARPASPLRGSSDEVVLSHATRVNQTVATSNLDMILLCVEHCQQVIWIDPRGRQFTREDMVLRCSRLSTPRWPRPRRPGRDSRNATAT